MGESSASRKIPFAAIRMTREELVRHLAGRLDPIGAEPVAEQLFDWFRTYGGIAPDYFSPTHYIFTRKEVDEETWNIAVRAAVRAARHGDVESKHRS